MPTTSTQKALRRARKAEAAALRMGALLVRVEQLYGPELGPLRPTVAEAVNDYRALVQAERNRAAMAKRTAAEKAQPAQASA